MPAWSEAFSAVQSGRREVERHGGPLDLSGPRGLDDRVVPAERGQEFRPRAPHPGEPGIGRGHLHEVQLPAGAARDRGRALEAGVVFRLYVDAIAVRQDAEAILRLECSLLALKPEGFVAPLPAAAAA